jgi:hypothetical protein
MLRTTIASLAKSVQRKPRMIIKATMRRHYSLILALDNGRIIAISAHPEYR